ncbi:MAG TPA: hypothetical protein VFH43_08985, partial [Candidatus Kapabacteria bacterium]|nr:hypothetical protein [Candidatus Kapabacteria bacterium]
MDPKKSKSHISGKESSGVRSREQDALDRSNLETGQTDLGDTNASSEPSYAEHSHGEPINEDAANHLGPDPVDQQELAAE